VNPEFEILPLFLPSNLEHLATLAEVKVLQRNCLEDLSELELDQLVTYIPFVPFPTVSSRLLWLIKTHRPYLQDVALAAIIVVELAVATMQWPTAGSRAEY
jgi:hypothetical protein